MDEANDQLAQGAIQRARVVSISKPTVFIICRVAIIGSALIQNQSKLVWFQTHNVNVNVKDQVNALLQQNQRLSDQLTATKTQLSQYALEKPLEIMRQGDQYTKVIVKTWYVVHFVGDFCVYTAVAVTFIYLTYYMFDVLERKTPNQNWLKL